MPCICCYVKFFSLARSLARSLSLSLSLSQLNNAYHRKRVSFKNQNIKKTFKQAQTL